MDCKTRRVSSCTFGARFIAVDSPDGFDDGVDRIIAWSCHGDYVPREGAAIMTRGVAASRVGSVVTVTL